MLRKKVNIRQAQLEASLETLRLEKRAAAIQAKVEALETAAELESRGKSSVIELPIEDTTEHTGVHIRTGEYCCGSTNASTGWVIL